MSIDELEHREGVLRNDFKKALEWLDVNGKNEEHIVKCVKTYGALWHYTHQLLMAERNETRSVSADSIQATGLRMTGGR